LRVRRGQNHHRNLAATGALPYALQNLPPGLLREVQVQQKQVGTAQADVPVHSVYKIYSLFAIVKYLELEIQSGLLQCLTNQKNVRFGILN